MNTDPTASPDGLHPQDDDVLGMGGEGSEIGNVTAQDGAARFRHGHNNGIHCRAPFGQGTERSGSARNELWQLFGDFASLEESVRERIRSLATTQALHQHRRGNDRWPETIPLEYGDHCRRILALTRQTGNSSRIEDEQAQDARVSEPLR